MARPTFARIDLDALIHNVREVKRACAGRKLIAVVKGDAYGHGMRVASLAMSHAGADMFAVATTEEAVELRDTGITEPIILIAPVTTDEIGVVLDHSLAASVVDERFADELAARARSRNTEAEVHVNVDTGMRRAGIRYPEAAGAIARIADTPGLKLAGVYTHYATAYEADCSFCRTQIDRLRGVVSQAEAAGVKIPLVHAANSAGVMRVGEPYFDAVRPGCLLYGLYPRWTDRSTIALKPALSLHTRVIQRFEVAAGEMLGYGHTFTTQRDSVVALLAIGYIDGYLSDFSNTGEVLIRGKRAPVVGLVCAQLTNVDCTDIPDVQTGDEVVVYGRQNGARLSIEEMAERLDKVPYTLTYAIARHLRRQFILGGRIIAESPTCSRIPDSVVQAVSVALRDTSPAP